MDSLFDYNIANAHARDRRIAFDVDTHTYTVDGQLRCDSVTELVEACFEQFDADYWSARKATPTHTAEQIKAEWAAKGEEARRLGTQLHACIESYYLDGHAPDAPGDARALSHFLAFAAEHPLTPFRSEWRIFSERYRLAGTLDFLAVDNGHYIIYDWKRSNRVVDPATGLPATASYGKCALAPIDSLPDTVYQHYALQLSFYRRILAEEYGIAVDACRLGVFHPGLPTYYLVEVPYLADEVDTILRSRL